LSVLTEIFDSVPYEKLTRHHWRDLDFVSQTNFAKKPYKKGMEMEFDLALTIFQVRTAKKISQQDLAREAKTTQAMISRLESGRYTPSLSFLKRVAKALDLAVRVSLEGRTL
jgi:ribosome-binding protein aMBF1 (putative translation factor)